MVKSKPKPWIELSDYQILLLNEALERGLPHAKGFDTLKKLLANAKQIKVR